MNMDEYRDRMATAHQAFTAEMMAMLAAYGRTQTVFTETLRDIERHFTDMEESQSELKRLIMDQGAQLREQSDSLRAQGEQLNQLRARLNGREEN
jgi:uncharacterized protein (UPF0332 family)